MFPQRTAFLCSLTALLLVTSLGTAGSVTYNVSASTSSLNGESGYLDFQFNPGDSSASAATATVSAFSSDGRLQPSAPLNGPTGAVSGTLPGTLTLSNSTAYNDYFEKFAYGNNISFALTLSGPAIGGSSSVGSAFALSLYDISGSIPLLTTDPNGSVLTVIANPNGSTSTETFPQSPGNDTPVTTVNPTGIAIPEPSSLMLSEIAVPTGLALWRRKRRCQNCAPA